MIAGIGQVIQDGSGLGNVAFRKEQEIIGGFDIAVGKIPQLPGEGVSVLPGAIGVIGNAADAAGDGIGG